MLPGHVCRRFTLGVNATLVTKTVFWYKVILYTFSHKDVIESRPANLQEKGFHEQHFNFFFTWPGNSLKIDSLAYESFGMLRFLIIHHPANVYFSAQKSHSYTYLTSFTLSELVKIPETSICVIAVIATELVTVPWLVPLFTSEEFFLIFWVK